MDASSLPKAHQQNGAKQSAAAERRRTKRVPLTFQIEVAGRDQSGALFRDRAVTWDVNEDGCRFPLLRQLKQGDFVEIRVVSREDNLPRVDKPTLFEVVWVEPGEMGWTVGVTTLRPENIWHMSFPSRK
jgi:hypothetical protein